MGMKVKEWGPEAWKFLHTLSFMNKNFDGKSWTNFIKAMSSVLPCIYCRSSVKQYMKIFPPEFSSAYDVQTWLYQLHGFVNLKLEQKGEAIKEEPSWAELKEEYSNVIKSKLNWEPQMWNFLFTLSENCPKKCNHAVKCKFDRFWKSFAELHPESELVKKYLSNNPFSDGIFDRDKLKWTHDMANYIHNRNGSSYTCDPLYFVHQKCKNRRVGKEDFKIHDCKVQPELVKSILSENTVSFMF